MADALPAPLKHVLDNMDAAITASEYVLEPFISVPLKSAVGKMAALDNARLNNALSFVATALVYGKNLCSQASVARCAIKIIMFAAHLRVGGVDTATHAIKDEIDATKKVFARVEEAKKILDARERKPISALNKEAADRFIKAGTPQHSGAVRSRAALQQEVGAEPDTNAFTSQASPRVEDARSSAARVAPHSKRPKHKENLRIDAGDRKPKSLDDRKRSTPQPHLSHVNWKEEMATKFAKSAK
jgi:hypothetical protein